MGVRGWRLGALLMVVGLVVGLALAFSPVNKAAGASRWDPARRCGSAALALNGTCHDVAMDRVMLGAIIGSGMVLVGLSVVALAPRPTPATA